MAASASPAPAAPPTATVQVQPRDRQAQPAEQKRQDPPWLIPFRFFDRHNGSFNAAAAIAVAIFTYFLWRFGERQTLILEQNAEETRDAIEIARNTAQAARDSADAYRDAERAWVGMFQIEHHILRTEPPYGDGRSFTFKLINSGRTPALKLKSYTSRAFVPIDSEVVPTLTKGDDSPGHMGSVIIPNMSVSSPPILFTRDEAAELLAHKAKAFIWIRLEYEDAMHPGTERVTEHCVEVTFFAHRRPTADAAPTDEAYSYRPLGPQNFTT